MLETPSFRVGVNSKGQIPLRIAVVLGATRSRFYGSAGTIVRNLIPKLDANAGSVRIITDAPQHLPAEARELLDPRDSRKKSRVPSALSLAHRVARASEDVLYFPYTEEAEWIWSKTPTLVTVHDLVALKMPGSFPRSHWRMKLLTSQGVRRATLVATVSHFSKGDVVRFLGIDPEKVRVIPNGVEPVQEPGPETQPTPPYLLYVASGGYPHKNISMLMCAFDKVAHLLPHDLHIVVTPAKRFWGDIVSAHQSLRTRGRVHLLSFLSQEELRAQYVSASVFVYPSQHEGFGIPILEAMSYGVPVIAGRVASIPEVAGDAAYYCDTADETALARTLVTVCMDTALRARLIARGKARITHFTWERTASLVVSACEDAMRLSSK